jgi:hypothetical protein
MDVFAIKDNVTDKTSTGAVYPLQVFTHYLNVIRSGNPGDHHEMFESDIFHFVRVATDDLIYDVSSLSHADKT